MKRLEAWLGLIVVVACPAGGCSKTEPQQQTTAKPTATTAVVPPSVPADFDSEARVVFKNKCVVCHGDHGAGDGPAAAALTPKPRAFADPEWQTAVTDEHIKKIIVEGGPGVGKSPAMPPNPDLKGKDEVVSALLKLIRDFKK